MLAASAPLVWPVSAAFPSLFPKMRLNKADLATVHD